MTVTVVIVTINRPECLKQCLECVAAQEPDLAQIIVVDASADRRTEDLIAEFPLVTYIRTNVGYGHMTASRNLGLAEATGEVVAFIDDDAFAREGWLSALIQPYEDERVGGVGGRAMNGQRGEEDVDENTIGRLYGNGKLTGNFAGKSDNVIEVDHIIGCNMSFRKSVLAELGGLREDYPGTEVREETDVSLRVRRLGYKILFTPHAVVDHIGAPQVRGKRFDVRYAYYASRNHTVLLVRNFGLGAGIVWECTGRSILNTMMELGWRVLGSVVRAGAQGLGIAVGCFAGVILLAKTGRDPVRRDEKGRNIKERLSEADASKTRIKERAGHECRA